MNICFETFGCRLNRAEALDNEALALARGHRIVSEHREADLIVVRACSVTGRAQRDSERLIQHLKDKYPNKRVVITGCLPGAVKFELKEHGTAESGIPAAVPMRTARAYLKVQDGCSAHCSFCIVPRFRGVSRSEPFEAMLDKAKRFIDAGYHEIVLTGCNLSLYADGMHHLPELVAALADLDPNCRVRLGSVEPLPLTRHIIELMAERENVCRFLHLPIQSGSEKVLIDMARPYHLKDVEEILAYAVDKIPYIGLGCDLIAGFPHETELDHRATLGLLKRHLFANVHVFPYSERPGTAASLMEPQLPHETRHHRAHEIQALADSARRTFAKKFLGREVAVVIEGEHHHMGWTGEYLWCEVNALGNLRRELVRVRVTESHGGELKGMVMR